MNTARRTSFSFLRRAATCALAVFVVASASHAARVKDLTLVEGGRDNQLVHRRQNVCSLILTVEVFVRFTGYQYKY